MSHTGFPYVLPFTFEDGEFTLKQKIAFNILFTLLSQLDVEASPTDQLLQTYVDTAFVLAQKFIDKE